MTSSSPAGSTSTTRSLSTESSSPKNSRNCKLCSCSNDQISAFEGIEEYAHGEENFAKARYLLSVLEKIVEKSKKVVGYQVELDMKQSDFNFVEDAYAFFAKVVEMWSLLNEWERDHGNWVSTPVLDLNAQEIKAKASAVRNGVEKAGNPLMRGKVRLDNGDRYRVGHGAKRLQMAKAYVSTATKQNGFHSSVLVGRGSWFGRS